MTQSVQTVAVSSKQVVTATCDLAVDPLCVQAVKFDTGMATVPTFGLPAWVTVGQWVVCPACSMKMLKTEVLAVKKTL